MICKNCQEEFEGNKVYCSLRCRNIYVNKYVRSYDKTKETFKTKRSKNEKIYYDSPKLCKACESIIPYEKKSNLYCNVECAHKNLNHSHPKSKETKAKLSLKAKEYLSKNFKMGCVEIKKRIFKLCKGCGSQIKNGNKVFCTINCKFETQKQKNEYIHYKNKTIFNFNLADFPEEFDFSLIEKYGWYSPTNKNNNLNGVSRDHIYSVKEGFENSVSPEIISHPANCQLLLHSENISKNKKSNITLEELLDKIAKFEEKYEIKSFKDILHR